MNHNINEVVKPQCPYKNHCLEYGFNDDCLEPFGKAIMNPCPHHEEIIYSSFGEIL